MNDIDRNEPIRFEFLRFLCQAPYPMLRNIYFSYLASFLLSACKILMDVNKIILRLRKLPIVRRKLFCTCSNLKRNSQAGQA